MESHLKRFFRGVFMDKNSMRKMFIYLGTALIVPTIFQVVFQKSIDGAKDFYGVLLYSIGIFILCVVIILIIELVKFYVRLRKSKSCKEILKSIDTIGNGIKLPDGTSMFDVLEETYSLCDSIVGQENKMQRALHNTHHIVYHSTTAKKHLNWIEYVFWSFVKKLHDQLGCEIIISLHYDEKARETGLADHKEQNRYDELYRVYSHIAKSLIGNDITVIDEKEFRTQRKHAQLFASSFHDRYVKCLLKYVKQLDDNEIDYKGFMRKVSYIESVFPVMAFSKTKWRNSRLYVLDRESALEVWRQSPFIEYKSTHGIFFITAQTIKNRDGLPLRIFSPEDTVNIDDNAQTITRKLSGMDDNTKETMFFLLKSAFNSNSARDEKISVDGLSDDMIKDLILDIKAKYHFDEA